MTTAAGSVPLLECHGIGKRFGGEVALEQVDFTLYAGEVHGVVGGNGAGKSTLMKILAGALPDHDGVVFVDGEPIDLSNPRQALAHGIAMVYQELSGIGQLSVAENLFLGRQLTKPWGAIDWRRMVRLAREYLGELHIDIDVRRRLDNFPLVIRQMVEIARGLHSGARVLILDEPTSALSPPESKRLFELIAQLRPRGVAVVFISHFIEDVLEICDRITILRDGRRLESSPVAKLDKHYVIHTMLGHELEGDEVGYESSVRLPARSTKPPVLSVERLSRLGAFESISFDVAAGECLGLYGYVGAGHQELAHALAGAAMATGGNAFFEGRPLPLGDVSAAVHAGVVLVAADRALTLVRRAQIYKNVTIAHLRRCVGQWLTRTAEISVSAPVLDRVKCQPADPQLPAGNLSGGNQQKVAMSKWLVGPIRVLVLEEPTRGMDVGAKDEIMRLVGQVKAEGAAVVLASCEPELVMAHCDRILVFSRGRQTAELVDTGVDKAGLMRWA